MSRWCWYSIYLFGAMREMFPQGLNHRDQHPSTYLLYSVRRQKQLRSKMWFIRPIAILHLGFYLPPTLVDQFNVGSPSARARARCQNNQTPINRQLYWYRYRIFSAIMEVLQRVAVPRERAPLDNIFNGALI